MKLTFDSFTFQNTPRGNKKNKVAVGRLRGLMDFWSVYSYAIQRLNQHREDGDLEVHCYPLSQRGKPGDIVYHVFVFYFCFNFCQW